MTQSEEKAAEKFTLEYHLKMSKEETPQKELICCLKFATDAHKEQKRKDVEKTPYINHPIGVAQIVSEEGGITNLDLIRGCLLHDTVEDTAVKIEMIRAKFGPYIGDLVADVTDNKALPKQERKKLQICHARTTSPQGKMVKLADKLYNLRDLERSLPNGWTEERRQEYYKWAFQVCEGLRGVSPKLEEKLDDFFIRKGLILERKLISERLEEPDWVSHTEIKPLLDAANFAAHRHRQHTMFDASNSLPYINHLVSVAFLVSQEAGIEDIPVLCAALLCDVVGKTETTMDEIMESFGRDVKQLVAELTHDHSLSIEDQFKNQMSMATNLSHSAKVIMLAAITDNCRTLEVLEPEGWAPGLRENYFKWSHDLSSLLSNTQPELEQELGYIWVGQGLKPFSMQSKEEPTEL